MFTSSESIQSNKVLSDNHIESTYFIFLTRDEVLETSFEQLEILFNSSEKMDANVNFKMLLT